MAKSKARENGVRSPGGRVWDPNSLKQTQLASLLGVSGPAITKWGGRGCPRNEDKTYSLAAVAGWMRQGGGEVGRVSQKQALGVLGVSKPTLLEWAKRGCPRNDGGSYDIAAVVQWRLAQVEERIKAARRLSDLEVGRARKTTADAELAEMTVALRKGELLPRAAVVAGWVGRYKAVQARLLGMLGRLGSRGVSDEHVELVRAEVLDVMRALAAGQVAMQLSPEEAAVLTELLGLDAVPTADEGDAV